MKIFISSVRNGLEAERDALPGLIKALGHEPVRFEDFTAKSVPSRQACIEGVESSDAYFLLLGPYYGHVFPETGQSATHDEWVTAEQVGLPRYVFRKTGIEFEPAQTAFEQALGDYGSGRFYKNFADVSELLSAVAAAVREVETTPDPLNFQPLTKPVTIQWLAASNRRYGSSERPQLEIHVVPLGGKPLSTRLLEQIVDRLPVQVRASRLVSPTEALETAHEPNDVTLNVPTPTNVRWGETVSGSLASVRVNRDGQIAVAFRLPGDQMGSILDPQDITIRIAAGLRIAGQLDLTEADRIAIGVGLTSTSMVAIGQVRQPARNSSKMSMTDSPIRVEPDETLTRSVLDRGADEVAATLSRSLLRTFNARPH